MKGSHCTKHRCGGASAATEVSRLRAGQRNGARVAQACSAIGVRLPELAILVTAHEWQQPVEWAIHAPIAAREGIPAETIATIARGEGPATLADDEAAVYDLCTQHRRHRGVSDVCP